MCTPTYDPHTHTHTTHTRYTHTLYVRSAKMPAATLEETMTRAMGNPTFAQFAEEALKIVRKEDGSTEQIQ